MWNGKFIWWQDGKARHISKIANMDGSGEVMVGEGTLATWLLRVGRRVSVCQWSSMEPSGILLTWFST